MNDFNYRLLLLYRLKRKYMRAENYFQVMRIERIQMHTENLINKRIHGEKIMVKLTVE